MATPEGLTDSRSPVPLQFEPGFFSEGSDRGVQNHWKDGDRVRFKNGLPQKIGGWVSRAVGGAVMQGVDRRDHEWVSLDEESWIAQGTSKKLYLLNNEIRYDITPVRASGTLGTDPFAVVNTLTLVTVTDVAHGASAGDFVRFTGATAGGGITIVGEYEIVEVLTSDSYTINHTAPATSTDATTGGAAVTFSYDINIGLSSNEEAFGYGTLLYGESTWGTPRATGTTVVVRLRIWSLDNFGEDLIASPRDGAVYHWDRTNGPNVRAVLLPNAPETNKRVLMSQTGGQIICLGAYDDVAGSTDPMLIRVGDEESLTDFTIAEDNNVFEKRLSKGSTIITGLVTRNGVMVFTDTAVYIMIPSSTEVFDVPLLATRNSVIGPNAAIDVDGTVYLMANKKFMSYDGVYSELPCPVWGYVFDNEDLDVPGFNSLQSDKVYCWHNQTFNEVWWHYPGRGSSENDRCVIYNVNERIWYYLAIERTVGLTPGPAYKVPTATDNAGTLFLHETGVDDDTSPMNEFIESYDAQIGDGKTAMHVSSIVPDMKRQLGTLLLTLKAKNRPQQAIYIESGPYPFVDTDEAIGVRAAGRQMALRLESNETGTDWRYAPATAYTQADAER